ncbi:Fc.00g040690.m01.CDS01 [Cosmosporella sp. VM-42]
MASQAIGSSATDPRPTKTKYYFAYGSNLHLKQMKKRCPNSKFIGCARLSNYRWQINERGYANVVEAEGRWVDGLVYEIDQKDEARLDINEGVSKNAYTKRHMPVLLRRAQRALYRRPTSWIVDKGGPAKVSRLAKQGGQKADDLAQHWEQNVLVYISLNYIQDSKPKDEYVNRINLGLADARVLGLENDYISNCIRPFIPASKKPQGTTPVKGNPIPTNEKGKQPARGVKGSAPQRTVAERSPARKPQAPNRPKEQAQNTPQRTSAERSPTRQSQPPARTVQPRLTPTQRAPTRGAPTLISTRLDEQVLQRIPAMNTIRQNILDRRRASSDVGVPPPLPPRPPRRLRSIPIIIVEETYGIPQFR